MSEFHVERNNSTCPLRRLKVGQDPCNDDSGSWHYFPRQIPIGRKKHVLGHFTDMDHIWRLLQLEGLTVGELGFGMDNEVGVDRAIFLLAFSLRLFAYSWKTAVRATAYAAHTLRGVYIFGGVAGSTLEVKLCSAGGED